MLVIPPSLEAALKNSDRTALAAYGALAVGLLYGVHQLVFTSKKQSRRIHNPDSTLPIIGNVLDASNADQFHDWMLEQCIKFKGEPWQLNIPGDQPTVIMYTPEMVEDVTIKQSGVFLKGQFQRDRVEQMFGNSIVVSEGERWVRQRKASVRFFTSRTLRAFVSQAMKKNLGKVSNILDNSIKDNTQVDMKKLFVEFTMSTFMEMGIGRELDWIGRDKPHPFEVAFDEGSQLLLRRFQLPGFIWKLERWLNVGKEKEFAEYCNTLQSFIHSVVKESMEAAMEKRAKGEVVDDKDAVKSIVELFVEQSDEDTDGLRFDDLVESLLTFVIAARDTTALTLTWMFYELGRHPEVVEKIRKEMADKLTVSKDAYLTSDDIRSLTYLEAVIKESLRLHAVAPFTTRQADKDTVVCGDIPIKKGQTVGLAIYALNRNPLVWGDDAQEFNPNRWIDPKTGDIINVPTTKLFNFTAGPRICVGMNLAMMELRVVSANLLHKYRFDVDFSKNDGSYSSGMTLNLKHPLLVNVKRV
ncbi:hypothetical protein Poli38472_004434 [Pythium oligandrum]|uniref:Cytochrome P450 n=1 Tax=Pythium oligandrum TaxID=41045 RepID=A0A8K1CA81_PYTOL|nr:hypothetical protein Poli38472_004434 [Pythium oligandrum]|eukprot:TMW59365.1 hypothetical protein Poli38472_004434 [Pythium oligandrum]